MRWRTPLHRTYTTVCRMLTWQTVKKTWRCGKKREVSNCGLGKVLPDHLRRHLRGGGAARYGRVSELAGAPATGFQRADYRLSCMAKMGVISEHAFLTSRRHSFAKRRFCTSHDPAGSGRSRNNGCRTSPSPLGRPYDSERRANSGGIALSARCDVGRPGRELCVV